MRQVLAWALVHDPDAAARLAAALGWWWWLRGRTAGQYGELREISARAETGSDAWCAAQFWLSAAAHHCSEHAAMLEHATALVDAAAGRPRALADGLTARTVALCELGRAAEAAGDARRALAVARESHDRAMELFALGLSAYAARGGDDLNQAVQFARQAAQITDGVPGWFARWAAGQVLTSTLIMAGDLAAADEVCAPALARCREVGDVCTQWFVLPWMVILDLHAGRAQDAAVHLREGIEMSQRTGGRDALVQYLDCCGYLCAETGRPAEAITIWAAFAVLLDHYGTAGSVRRRAEPLRAARQALGSDRARAAEDRGAAMNLATAAEYALMLTAPEAQQAPQPKLAHLSTRERELVTLVAGGRTDAQIASELYISVSTVRTHLDRIRDKTGCRRRADLTRLALQAQLT